MAARIRGLQVYGHGRQYTIHGSDLPRQRQLWATVARQARLLRLPCSHLYGLVDHGIHACGTIAGHEHVKSASLKPGDPLPWMLRELAGLLPPRRLSKAGQLALVASAIRMARRKPELSAEAKLCSPRGAFVLHSLAFGYADEWVPLTPWGHGPPKSWRRRAHATEFFEAMVDRLDPCGFVVDHLGQLPRTAAAVLRCAKASLQIPDQAQVA